MCLCFIGVWTQYLPYAMHLLLSEHPHTFKKSFYFYVCGCFTCMMYVYLCVWCSWPPEKQDWSLRAGVTDVSEPPCGFWEWILGPQERAALNWWAVLPVPPPAFKFSDVVSIRWLDWPTNVHLFICMHVYVNDHAYFTPTHMCVEVRGKLEGVVPF